MPGHSCIDQSSFEENVSCLVNACSQSENVILDVEWQFVFVFVRFFGQRRRLKTWLACRSSQTAKELRKLCQICQHPLIQAPWECSMHFPQNELLHFLSFHLLHWYPLLHFLHFHCLRSPRWLSQVCNSLAFPPGSRCSHSLLTPAGVHLINSVTLTYQTSSSKRNDDHEREWSWDSPQKSFLKGVFLPSNKWGALGSWQGKNLMIYHLPYLIEWNV